MKQVSGIILFAIISYVKSNSCRNGLFTCADGTCIESTEICNGFINCPDGSDEIIDLCRDRPCSSEYELFSINSLFRCQYGACIPEFYVCDGNTDCADASDETNDLCGSKKCKGLDFKCNYGACIGRLRVCDNIQNCADGSDETSTACKKIRKKCKSSHFKCNYGSCILKAKKCDGSYDCLDKSDEDPVLCGYDLDVTTPPPQVNPSEDNNDTTTCSKGDCRCPPPKDHVCVPCDQAEDTCSILDNKEVCEVIKTPGMTVDILSCHYQDFFSGCNNPNAVPVLTVAQVTCWQRGTPTLMQCRSDGQWHHYYVPSDTKDQYNYTPVKHLCQPNYLNSHVCGKRPSYIKDEQSLDWLDRITVRVRWPWLVGLLKSEEFACTGTIISPTHILTAAHCVTRSQESSKETMHPWDLKIQYMNYQREINVNRVVKIFLHPAYRSGRRPTNDMAIIKLQSPIIYSRYVYPACVRDRTMSTLHQGLAFQRLEGQKEYFWTIHEHVTDPSCYASGDRCDDTLTIRENEFCSFIINSTTYLLPGSSGGPYLYNNGDDATEHWSVSGIISYSAGISCSRPRTVFTDVFSLWCWIDNCVHHSKCGPC